MPAGASPAPGGGILADRAGRKGSGIRTHGARPPGRTVLRECGSHSMRSFLREDPSDDGCLNPQHTPQRGRRRRAPRPPVPPCPAIGPSLSEAMVPPACVTSNRKGLRCTPHARNGARGAALPESSRGPSCAKTLPRRRLPQNTPQRVAGTALPDHPFPLRAAIAPSLPLFRKRWPLLLRHVKSERTTFAPHTLSGVVPSAAGPPQHSTFSSQVLIGLHSASSRSLYERQTADAPSSPSARRS